jgi:hypothetical protein
LADRRTSRGDDDRDARPTIRALPLPVLAPFASGGQRAVALSELAALAGATMCHGTVVSVDAESRAVALGDGRRLAHDAC